MKLYGRPIVEHCRYSRGRAVQSSSGTIPGEGRLVHELQIPVASKDWIELFNRHEWIIATIPEIPRKFRKILQFFLHFQRIWTFLNIFVKFRIFSSKFRREITILVKKLRMFEWIIIHFYSKLPKLWRVFCWNFEFWAVQKYVNFVDLEKYWKISIWLQTSASIQPRTSLSKFGDIESFIQSTP